MSKLPRYNYKDLHPKHEAFKIAEYWGSEGQDLVTATDPSDAIESIIDDCHPTPISELGTIELYGYEDYPDCPEYDLPEEGEPIREVCMVLVDPLEWAKKNRPDWLEE